MSQSVQQLIVRDAAPQEERQPRREVHVGNASVGKRQRAEPVAALCGEPDDEASWKRSILWFLGDYPQLEDELTGWVPDVSKTSPNRADAMWWACHDLFPDLMGQEWTPSPVTVGGESRTSPLAGIR